MVITVLTVGLVYTAFMVAGAMALGRHFRKFKLQIDQQIWGWTIGLEGQAIPKRV